MTPLTMSLAMGVRSMLHLPQRPVCGASGRLVACGCTDPAGYVHCYSCQQQVHTTHDLPGTVRLDRHWGQG